MRTIPKKAIFWGGTGQAKVNRTIAEQQGIKIVGVIDDTPGLPSPFADVPLFSGEKGLQKLLESHDPKSLGFSVSIGNPHGLARLRIHYLLLETYGLIPLTLIHSRAIVAPNAKIGPGCQIMAGAIVGEETELGAQCIINTKASVDHECKLGDGSELAPGATLCGLVELGINAWVCAGATVAPRMQIGENSVVGAGAVVLKNVPANTRVFGVPAQPKRG